MYIKKLRKEFDWTQAQLAEGICAQTMISKIENNEVIPNEKILKKLSKKFNEDLVDFRNVELKTTYIDKIKNIKDMIDISLTKRDYGMIELIYRSNLDTIKDNETDMYTFYFRWIKGLLYYYRENNPNKALQEFDKLSTADLSPDLAVDVTCSIGIVYYELENYEKSCKYFEMGLKWFSNKIGIRSKVKLLLNYSLCLESLNKDEYALELLFQGIEISKCNNSIMGLADLYYHRGFILNKLKQYEEATKSYKISQSLFEIQENSKFSVLANLRLEELMSNKKSMDEEKDYA
ncbi:DNA-binding XRE family transcriptional regulator [Alkalibacterium olivapovliticus]|uniref:DNA-binding XRE family transcriptional regulator n=2 Tax=Alkalibacterium olivapovliticus TaxID=99907 RepID=A0A2T0VWA4_9LACT|nr:DNA-binding XRE family transcriptional regulator [Alkalibacterium olivapovliticus]